MPVNLKTIIAAVCPNQLPFKDGCANQWYERQSGNTDALSQELISWLYDQDSLTQRLQSHCQQFEVMVLRETDAVVTAAEQQLFNPGEVIRSREVLLLCDGQPHVYARTLIPKTTLDYANNLLKKLGNTSLGEVLFRADDMKRQPIETTSFSSSSSMSRFATALTLTPQHPLWARRSIFILEGNPLLVSEVFLPHSYAYSKGIES